MEYLHISETIITTYRDNAGTPYKRISRPSGLWYGHGLSWVRFMQSKSSWSPQIHKSPLQPLPLYEHVFEGKKIPPRQKGDSFQTIDATLHAVYSLPIPNEAFQSPGYSGDDKIKKVMKIDKSTLDELIKLSENNRSKWYENKAASALEANYGGSDPLGDMLTEQMLYKNHSNPPNESYIAILQYLLSINFFDAKKTQRIEKIVSGNRDVPLINLKATPEIRKAIADAVFQRKLPLTPEIIEIEDLFWNDEINKIVQEWGGMDFADDLFEEEYFKQLPLLQHIEAGSGVLFKPTQVLGKTDAISDLRVILYWNNLPHYKNQILEKKPKYVFGMTTDGKLRLLYPPTGGRLRTRRYRVLKNPKTLKKRIR